VILEHYSHKYRNLELENLDLYIR